MSVPAAPTAKPAVTAPVSSEDVIAKKVSRELGARADVQFDNCVCLLLAARSSPVC
jgi:hypothetical protein